MDNQSTAKALEGREVGIEYIEIENILDELSYSSGGKITTAEQQAADAMQVSTPQLGWDGILDEPISWED